jgi:3-dehydroquinate synthase
VETFEEFLDIYERYLAERRPAYELADLTVPVDSEPVKDIVEEIVARLNAEPTTRTIEVATGPQPYPVYVDDGVLARLGALCTDAGLSPRATLITSEPLWHLYGEKAQASLHTYGFETRRILIPDGEAAKNLSEVALIYQALAEAHHERGDPVIALGGGTVGDVAGFAAATYLRGVPVVQVPTTLLAQVDSAIGGKTGVNLKAGKNLVGAFWQPRLVVCDTHLIASLPRRQVASGLAEVVKYACISHPVLLDMVGESLTQLLHEPPRVDPELVALCVKAKADVVAVDEREADRRRMLNFGHTFGHALEATLGYDRLLHGEAVALGMLVALELSVKFTGLAEPTAERITSLLRQIFKGLDFPDVPFVRVSEAMTRDKKVQGGRSIWVLLKALGDPVLHYVADTAAVERAVAAAQTRWTRR